MTKETKESQESQELSKMESFWSGKKMVIVMSVIALVMTWSITRALGNSIDIADRQQLMEYTSLEYPEKLEDLHGMVWGPDKDLCFVTFIGEKKPMEIWLSDLKMSPAHPDLRLPRGVELKVDRPWWTPGKNDGFNYESKALSLRWEPLGEDKVLIFLYVRVRELEKMKAIEKANADGETDAEAKSGADSEVKSEADTKAGEGS